jgi:hypothetical protein
VIAFDDELARGLASGALSRRKALRLMGAALVGGTLASLGGIGEAAADPPGCKRNGKHCKKDTQCCSGDCSSSGTCVGDGVGCVRHALSLLLAVSVYHHFRRFRLSGMWHLILTSLRTAERQRMGRDTQPTAAIIDAQSMKTVEESFGPNLLYIVRRPLCIGGFTLRGMSYVWSRGRAVDRLTKETDNTHRTYNSPS